MPAPASDPSVMRAILAAGDAAPIDVPEGDDMDLTEATARIAELEAQLEAERLANAQAAARAVIAERLADSDLPAFAVRRIEAALVADLPRTESGELAEADALIAAIDAAVQEWRADLAGELGDCYGRRGTPLPPPPPPPPEPAEYVLVVEQGGWCTSIARGDRAEIERIYRSMCPKVIGLRIEAAWREYGRISGR